MILAELNPVWLIAAVVAAGLLFGAVWVLVRYRRRTALNAPDARCGQCGYAVAGLPTFTCPECGSDLRTVGITRTTPAGRTPMRDAARLIATLAIWTLIYGLLYACIGAGSYPRHPWDSSNRPTAYGFVDGYYWPYQGKSTHSVTLEPTSEAFRRIIITERREAAFHGWRHAPQIAWTGDTPNVGLTHFSIAIQLDNLAGKSVTMTVDPADLTWTYDDPLAPGKQLTGKPLDGAIVWGWMMRSGVDQPSPVVKEEAETVFDLVDRSIKSGAIGPTAAPWAIGRLERIAAQQRDSAPGGPAGYTFKTTRGTAEDIYGPAWSIYWLSIPFGLGVYTYGANWIFAWHKRRLAGFRPIESARP